MPEQESETGELSNLTGRGIDDLIGEAIAGYLEHLAASRQILDQRYDEVKTGKKALDEKKFSNGYGPRVSRYDSQTSDSIGFHPELIASGRWSMQCCPRRI